ncbi:response regulator transcription factor [Clostridium sp. 19966]|uniref:response regulator transcription factor n=1 Tax=Clostridium sp. 19966 TaxID=2768166 RepID=UPI0028DEECFE|nr:response regulator transcription factor [Clostridium sp. 19966]MDT8716008.1 response regulator transcription factor [Clostridium sp. 19966]
MKNILIIEDEKNVLDIMEAYLVKEGYNVMKATRGEEGLEIFKRLDFQLIILDLMLPGISGEEVCREIRKISNAHIFILTAKSSLEDRVEGFNIGADEYLIKPFSPREIVARVNAVFRRINKAYENQLIFDSGNLIIDNDRKVVEVRGNRVDLTPNEFNILYELAINKGVVLSREKLIEKVFGMDFDGFDRTIDVHIKNLRKKIEENSKEPKYVITVYKTGYKFGGA